jgi:ribosomal-protein-alanine N-acetyltransferase
MTASPFQPSSANVALKSGPAIKAELEPPGQGRPRRLEVAAMTSADIATVLHIEALSFASAWPQNAFVNEIRDNKLAHYFVGRLHGEIVAYGGIWVILEDSHVTTIAVHPDYRGRKLGEEMLVHLLDEAIAARASWITLEVRESNESAQRLYRKYGFTVVSTRRGYYSDNNENALVMWAGNLKGPLYASRLAVLKDTLARDINADRR